MGAGHRLARADSVPVEPGTRHRDYILTAYEPRVPPAGRLQPQSILRHVLRREKLLEQAWPVIETLRSYLGPDETVWGAKWGPGGFALELYFYNFLQNGTQNRASATRLAGALRPHVAIAGEVDESLPYFMCSLELDARVLAERRATPWRIYLGSGDRARVQCGFSYRAEGKGDLVLENHYWFYRAAEPKDREDALRRVAASPRAGSPRLVDKLAPAYLHDCYTICCAVKPHADGLYFSRISTPQLAQFLAEHDHQPLATTLGAYDDALAHLSWDLGYDYTQGRVDKLAVHGVV